MPAMMHSSSSLTLPGKPLLDDLLTLSRLEMSTGERAPEPVDVPALLRSIVNDAQVLASEGRQTLHLETQPDLWLQGRSSELQSAFSNLIYNAVRHTPQYTKIRIRWCCQDGDACLSVADNGPGIAPRHIPRLTERFYQVDESRSGTLSGSGLGLSIVKHVLDSHGATLNVTSREGDGTTFQCRFPKAHVVAPTKRNRVASTATGAD